MVTSQAVSQAAASASRASSSKPAPPPGSSKSFASSQRCTLRIALLSVLFCGEPVVFSPSAAPRSPRLRLAFSFDPSSAGVACACACACACAAGCGVSSGAATRVGDFSTAAATSSGFCAGCGVGNGSAYFFKGDDALGVDTCCCVLSAVLRAGDMGMAETPPLSPPFPCPDDRTAVGTNADAVAFAFKSALDFLDFKTNVAKTSSCACSDCFTTDIFETTTDSYRSQASDKSL
mmetsp:Transcript_5720/g.14907  ORF Transcript_5720/g.14907 Transcript_5720/m.14907 type:complete len:234 (+) Transcript_5720:45-746(+)